MRVIFSGIQPTGVPHLGNFLGAIKKWVTLQRQSQSSDTLIFSIVGWHALTLPQVPEKLRTARRDTVAALLAFGLDPKRCIIFQQDENPHHIELGWTLNCATSVGRLRRMTTWKSRIAISNIQDVDEVSEESLNAGLLTYPVLQAADILLYGTTHVPVGDDQRQHLELTRDLADTFNRKYSGTFKAPEILYSETPRIMSLNDPESKMSKSSPNSSSRIELTDSRDNIFGKIQRAVTDSEREITFEPRRRPGTANILEILAASSSYSDGTEKLASSLGSHYRAKGHKQLKLDTAEAVEALLSGPRQEFARLRKDDGYLSQVTQDGLERARRISEQTIMKVRQSLGLSR